MFLSLKPFRHNGSLSDAHFECSFAGAGLLQGPENRLQRQTTALKAGKWQQGGCWPSHVRNMCLTHHVWPACVCPRSVRCQWGSEHGCLDLPCLAEPWLGRAMQVNRAIKNRLHSVLLRLSTCLEHASLCYEHRVAQSHLAGISFSCMPRHVTVGGFEPNQWSSHCQSCMHDLLLCTIGIHARRNRSDERDACLAMRAANVRMHHTWLSCWSPSQKFL